MSIATITTLTDRVPQPAGLVWENPPTKPKTGKYAEIATALRERPGQWARPWSFSAERKKRGWSFASALRSGKFVDFPRGDFEAKAVTMNDGQVGVWVRAVSHG